jgi:large subunit ribosomal protein L23
MKPASEIISRPILTEKASGLAEANKYVFEILPGADRAQVKTAIEAAFKVTVQKVNILIRKGKVRRSRLGGGAIYTESVSRRAIVTLKKGDVISLA